MEHGTRHSHSSWDCYHLQPADEGKRWIIWKEKPNCSDITFLTMGLPILPKYTVSNTWHETVCEYFDLITSVSLLLTFRLTQKCYFAWVWYFVSHSRLRVTQDFTDIHFGVNKQATSHATFALTESEVIAVSYVTINVIWGPG